MIRFYILLIVMIIVGVYCSYETIQLNKLQAEMKKEHRKYQEELRKILERGTEDSDFQYRK